MTAAASVRSRVSEGEELARELRRRVSGDVRVDSYTRALYSTDASIFQMEPVGVVLPRSHEDVVAAMEIASKNGVWVLPRCGGTSLAGQAVNHALVIDFSKYMNGLLEVNQEEGWARVQPGIVLDDLNRQIIGYGLQYAPDPTTSNRACVGGGIGNNTCGSHSVIYGKTIDHIKEVQVVLSDASTVQFRQLDAAETEARLAGSSFESHIHREITRIAQENAAEIDAHYPKILRRVSGYNLDDFAEAGPMNMVRMVVGSEGTLCVATETKVNLVARPQRRGLAVLHFEDLFRACEATPQILEHEPSAVELIDKMMLDRCRSSLGYARRMTFLQGEPGALLLVEFYGESEAELRSKLDRLQANMESQSLAYTSVNLIDAAEQANVWAIRRAGLGLLMSIHGDAKPLPYVEDTAVAPEKLGEYVRRFDEVVRAHNTEAGYYGHASVGCLHIRPLINLKDQEGIDRMLSIASDIADLVLEFGGSLSGEHGDGIVRGVWTERMFGPRLYDAFRQVKGAFDPMGIMNPGKIIDCPPLVENLRYGTGYRAFSTPTHLDFSADTDYAGAVEMCNGMGACRKAEGTMCPSYMATKEEEHSTRGRANLLRAILSGALPGETLGSKRLYQAMDLCLECKGCKAECPSGVDMAKLKYEFLNQYNRSHRIPWRARIFADINRLSRIGCRLAPVSNWAAANPLSRWMMHWLLGIHARRSLPPLARQTLPAWFRSHRRQGNATRGKVVLFNDTFMNYNYPSVGIAAVELLERAGLEVSLANPVCCGRPMISKGMLEKATDHARRNVEMLHRHVVEGAVIVGCEPSCLLTLRDEYPDLLRDDRSQEVARNSFLIDEYLAQLEEQGQLDLRFKDEPRKILFHGHCHQKAIAGTANSIKVLSLPPSFQVEEVDSGCCGMAGAFGFEKEHYDISMTIGRQVLFPAVQAKGEDWEVVVTGVSCRQQVEQGTGRRARHLVEVLRDALA